MKNINDYICESSNEEIMSQYAKGDKCLYLHNSGLRNQEKVTIEAVQITKVTKTLLEFDYLTHFSVSEGSKNKQIKCKKSYNNIYASTSGMTSTTMIIPKTDTAKILKLIEKNDNKLDFYTVLWGKDQRKDYMNPVMQLKDNQTYDPKFDDYENVSKETIDKIKAALK